MYVNILNFCAVYRISDNKLISPCDSVDDPDFIEYNDWVNKGNVPLEIYAPSEDYEYINGEFVIKLETVKNNTLSMVSDKFNYEFQYGSFVSSLGFRVDNRRYENKNDKENIDMLIDLSATIFKDADGIEHNVSLSDLNTIRTEMMSNTMERYNKKWYYENFINTALTKESLEHLLIEF